MRSFLALFGLALWTALVVWVIVPATLTPMTVLVATDCPGKSIRVSATFEEDHDWSAGCKNIERHAL